MLRKDLDLGLQSARDLDVPMPLTAAAREVLQMHIGMSSRQVNPEGNGGRDFAAMFETLAAFAGVRLESENMKVSSGLETE